MDINLHTLVIINGTSVKNNNFIAQKYFDDYEILSLEKIRYELFGNKFKRDCDPFVYEELIQRIKQRLLIGERSVIIDTSIDTKKLVTSVKFDFPYVKVEYIDEDKDLNIVKKHVSIKKNFSGITVIGDIHGNLEEMTQKVEEATAKNHYIILLGDIIDYGTHSLKCMEMAYDLLITGKATIIRGNHERKIYNWLKKTPNISISEGNKTTIGEFNALSNVGKGKWKTKFMTVYYQSLLTFRIDNFVFAHAAIHSSYWQDYQDYKMIEHLALFGEVKDGKKRYDWVSYIPPEKTVMVGHDIVSKDDVVKKNTDTSGAAYFMDTGCSKGGKLSSVDLKFSGKLHIVKND